MIDTNEIKTDAPVLRHASQKHRTLAFLTTALAAFLLISLSWPLSMNGYRSQALIDFDGQVESSLLVEMKLPSVLKSMMDPVSMSRRLEQAHATIPCSSRLLNSNNLQVINERIRIGFRDSTETKNAQLRVAFAGSGKPDEAEFIKLFAAEVASRLTPQVVPTDANVASHSQTLDQASWLVDQIEEGVTSAKNQTAELVAHTRSNEQPSVFRNVGHVQEMDVPDVDSLQQTLASVDVSSLRGVIQQIKTTNGQANTGPVRFNVDSVSNEPIGALPSSASLMLAGMLSLIIGGVVAWNVHPFSEQGFQNVDDVANQLGVRVIGTLGRDDSYESAENETKTLGWANKAFHLSGTIVVAIGILAIGFWLTSADVRQAFAQSMFHGLARIVWNLTGA